MIPRSVTAVAGIMSSACPYNRAASARWRASSLDRTLGGPRVTEAFISDRTKLANALSAVEHVARGEQIEALPIPAFRLIKVTQVGDVCVRVTEVECADRLPGDIAAGAGKIERLAKGRGAGRAALFPLDFRQLL